MTWYMTIRKYRFAFQPEKGYEKQLSLTRTVTSFFVAIPPYKRNDWGLEMAALIKPGGYLICSVFPMLPPTDTGPPYFVRPSHYDGPLKANFNKVYDKAPTKTLPGEKGLEHVLVWRRKSMGYN